MLNRLGELVYLSKWLQKSHQYSSLTLAENISDPPDQDIVATAKWCDQYNKTRWARAEVQIVAAPAHAGSVVAFSFCSPAWLPGPACGG